jgi:hypothetical protein
MADEVGLTILLKALLNAKGFEDLQAELKKTAAAHQAAKGGANDFQDAIKNMGATMVAQLATFVAIGTAIAFIKSSITAAVAESRSLYQFDEANKRLGQSTAELLSKSRDWLKSMEDASGISKTQLIPAYSRLSEITTDVAATQGLMQIAAGAAARGLGEVGQISLVLGRFLLTGAIRPSGEFGLLLKKLHEQGKTTGEMMTVLAARFGDAGANVHNAGIEIDRMRIANERAKAALGETGATLLTELGPALRVVMVAIATVEAGFIKLVGATKSMGSTLGGLDAMMAKFFKGDFKGGIEEWKKGWADGDKALKESGDKATEVLEHVLSGTERSTAALKQANDKMIADILGGLEKGKKATGDAIADVNNKYKALIDQVKIDGGTEDEIVMKTIALLEQEAAAIDKLTLKHGKGAAAKQALMLQIADLRRKLNDEETKEVEKRDAVRAKDEKQELVEANRTYEAKLKLKEDETKEGRKAGSEYLKDMINVYKADLAGYKIDADEKIKIVQKLEKAEIDLVNAEKNEKYKILLAGGKQFQKMNDDELKSWRKKLEDELALYGAFTDQAIALRQKIADINIKLDQDEVSNRQLVEQSLMTIGTSIFGQNKTLAVAGAVINVAEGVTKALADYSWPYDMIVAAAVVAAGAAQISTIESASPGASGGGSSSASGFDNPSNDYAAFLGGQKWAGDMVRNYSGGAAAGWNAAMLKGGGGSSTSNVSNVSNRGGDRQINITIHGGILGSDDVAARQFVKRIAPYITRLDPRRNL